MADSFYSILEYRCLFLPKWTELYIRISDANDFMPIAGWYKKVISKNEPALPVITEALCNASVLLKWERNAPPPPSQTLTAEELAMLARLKTYEN